MVSAPFWAVAGTESAVPEGYKGVLTLWQVDGFEGGSGSRFGADRPKQFTMIQDKPLFLGILEKYCRMPEIDRIQIRRWKSFKRHKIQIEKNCWPGDLGCRPRQRQALLQWAYNPFI